MASMSILDDAIREHLELKRAHGADEAEVKKLEDEAFGPPARPEDPDPAAEAPTEFMTTEPVEGAASGEEPEGRRYPPLAARYDGFLSSPRGFAPAAMRVASSE